PAILAAFILVFIFTFTSFGVILILGDLQFMTLEVQIYYQAQNLFNLPLAAALSLVQIVTMLLMMAVYTRLQRRIADTNLQSSQNIARPAKTWREKAILGTNLAIMIFLLFTSLLALFGRSIIRNGSFSLEYYDLLSSLDDGSVLAISPLSATVNSLKIAFVVTLIAIIFGLITAYLIAGRNRPKWVSQFLDPIFM